MSPQPEPVNPTHVFVATYRKKVVRRLRREGFQPAQALSVVNALPIQSVYQTDIGSRTKEQWRLFLSVLLPGTSQGCLCQECKNEYDVAFDPALFNAVLYI